MTEETAQDQKILISKFFPKQSSRFVSPSFSRLRERSCSQIVRRKFERYRSSFRSNCRSRNCLEKKNLHIDLHQDHVQDLHLQKNRVFNNMQASSSENQDLYTESFSKSKNKFEVNMYTSQMTKKLVLDFVYRFS